MKQIAALFLSGFCLLIGLGCFIDPSSDAKKADDMKFMSYASLPWTEESIPPCSSPWPRIYSISPLSVVAQGDSFTLTVYGADFVSDSSVQWNGTPRTTTFISNTQLRAEIEAEDIATIGTARITVKSCSYESTDYRTFSISKIKTLAVNVPANDIVWDSVHQFLIASIPDNASTNANSIVVIDPATGNIQSTVFVGNEPNRLAISDDCQFLYVGLDGSAAIQRFTINGNLENPQLSKDISIALGSSKDYYTPSPYYAIDIQVAPATPHTIAVSLGIPYRSPRSDGIIVIFDDSNRRAALPDSGYSIYEFYSLQWGADNSILFAADSEDFYIISVSSNSVSLTKEIKNAFSNMWNIHYDRGTNCIYSCSGEIVDASGLHVGIFPYNGGYPFNAWMVPDSSLGMAFFLNGSALYTANITDFTPIDTAVMNFYPDSNRFIRWGSDGLALAGPWSSIYIVSGPFVLGN